MKNFISFLLCSFLFSSSWAQSTIQGKIIYAETGEELIGANVIVKQDKNFITSCATDFDGNYKVNIDTGIYKVIVSYIGLPDKQINGVIVTKGQTILLNIEIPDSDIFFWDCSISFPLIDKSNTTNQEFDSKEIQRVPTRSIKSLSSLTAGVTFQN